MASVVNSDIEVVGLTGFVVFIVISSQRDADWLR
jgi:hypothetical protein